jgi:hypothetical protein
MDDVISICFFLLSFSYVLRGERIRLNFGTQQTLRGERDRDRPARAMLADDGEFEVFLSFLNTEIHYYFLVFAEARLAPVAEAPPPADPALAQAIDTLARFVNRLGLTFEELVRDQQARNPKYSFLTGGAGSDYYEWRKYDLKVRYSKETKDGRSTNLSLVLHRKRNPKAPNLSFLLGRDTFLPM